MLRNNEKGYALLLVLLLVTIIMIVSASFVTASLSNAKQEKTVDTNNMAVVAAEMGVEYYLNKMKIEETKAAQSTLDVIEPYLNAYNYCNGETDLPGCASIKTIPEIKNIAIGHYISELRTLIKSFESEAPTLIDPSHELPSYFLKEPYVEKDGDAIIIKFNSFGSSTSMLDRKLYAKAEFTLPEFIEELTYGESNQPNPGSVSTPEDIFNYFFSHKDYKKVNQACSSQNGECQSGKFYSGGTKEVNNPNNKNYLFWVHEGLVDMGNMNSMGGNYTLIVESLKVSNMNSMSGKLVLLGKENEGGKIASNISVKFKSGGKVCINVDGYPMTEIQKISSDNNNQVLFYSGAANPVWPRNVKNESQKRTGSLTDFVNECTGIAIFELNSGPSYQTSSGSPSFEIGVDYGL